MDKLNIAINVGGYHKIGTGHIYRQISLIDEMPDHNYSIFLTPSQTLAQKVCEDNLIEYFLYKNIDELIKYFKKLKINIVINDVLDTDEKLIKNIKKENIFVVNFEDRGNGIKYADIVINDMYPPDKYKDNKNVYTGTEYSFMRRDLILYKVKDFNEIPKNIILTFGGSDPSNYTKRILNLLLNCNINNKINIIVILGLGYKYDDEILKYKTKKNVIILKNVKNMGRLLRKGDIAITSNGRTLLELTYFEIPSISLAQNDREKTHIHAKIENGVIFLGKKNEFTDNEFIKNINKLINDKEYRYNLKKKMKNHKQILLKSNKKICDLIINKYHSKLIDNHQ
jgi:spore coat polysaccharide biosynthesis predicted glycosyltransferase SpsG